MNSHRRQQSRLHRSRHRISNPFQAASMGIALPMAEAPAVLSRVQVRQGGLRRSRKAAMPIIFEEDENSVTQSVVADILPNQVNAETVSVQAVLPENKDVLYKKIMRIVELASKHFIFDNEHLSLLYYTAKASKNADEPFPAAIGDSVLSPYDKLSALIQSAFSATEAITEEASARSFCFGLFSKHDSQDDKYTQGLCNLVSAINIDKLEQQKVDEFEAEVSDLSNRIFSGNVKKQDKQAGASVRFK